VRFSIRVRGSGRAEVTANSIADAEHRVEKEIGRLWDGVRVRIRGVAWLDEAERITGEYDVEYGLEGSVEVDAEDSETARTTAYRQARERFAGTRYWLVAWDSAEVAPAGAVRPAAGGAA
jgi:hypothetical protein